MRRLARLAPLALSLVVACSSKDTPPAAPAVAPASAPTGSPTATAPTPTAPALPVLPVATTNPNVNGTEALNQFVNAMAGAQPGGKPGEVAKAVNWREILPVLVDAPAGWQASGPADGSTTSMGMVQVTQVKRSYKQGATTAQVEIADTSAGIYKMMATGFAMARTLNEDASDHYQRPIEVGGQPGLEKWQKGGSAEVNVFVGGRFFVSAKGNPLPDTKSLIALVGAIDVGKLAALAR